MRPLALSLPSPFLRISSRLAFPFRLLTTLSSRPVNGSSPFLPLSNLLSVHSAFWWCAPAPFPRRSHNCGELTFEDVGSPVVLAGWILPERYLSFLPPSQSAHPQFLCPIKQSFQVSFFFPTKGLLRDNSVGRPLSTHSSLKTRKQTTQPCHILGSCSCRVYSARPGHCPFKT
jgi:hypothetical protein